MRSIFTKVAPGGALKGFGESRRIWLDALPAPWPRRGSIPTRQLPTRQLPTRQYDRLDAYSRLERRGARIAQPGITPAYRGRRIRPSTSGYHALPASEPIDLPFETAPCETDSCRLCARRRSIGVMLIAASREQVASISAIAPNSVSSCADVALATVAPRRGLISIRPVDANCLCVSRTGVRETTNLSASMCSSRRKPGGNRPTIPRWRFALSIARLACPRWTRPSS